MDSKHNGVSEREHRLDEVVVAYLKAVEAGQKPDRQELLNRHADLLPELAQFFDDADALGGLALRARSVRSAGALTCESVNGTILEGKELGDFRIIREVGKGGMGIVYEAEQLSLRRRVALKVLPFAATMDPRHLQRFHNEAQAAACLHHTNIVPVFFVGSERGVHFYAMQFIDGQPLSEVIRQLRHAEKPESVVAKEQTAADSPPPEGVPQTSPTTRPVAEATPLTSEGRRGRGYYRKAAELVVQAADALDHAHQLGIVHRDVKPANLLLDARGNLWITDFGLAQVQSETRLTQTGDVVGTPRYMSPEQALAKHVPIDHRTDVYSLDVTLYELLTLRPAFTSEDRHELQRQIAFEEPAKPRRLERTIPVELEIIVLKAMEKRPQDRYATAQELANDLERWVKHEPIRARRPSLLQRSAKWGRRHRSVAVAGLLVLLLALIMLSISNVLIWHAKQETENALLISNMHAREVENFILITSEQRDLSEKKLQTSLQMINAFLLKLEEKETLPLALSELAIEGYENLLPVKSNSHPLRRHAVWAYVLLGNRYAMLDRFAEAEANYAKADSLLRLLIGEIVGPGVKREETYQPPQGLEESFRRAVAHWRETGRGWEKVADYRLPLVKVTRTSAGQDEERYHQEKIGVMERVFADLPTLEHRSTLMDWHHSHGFDLWRAGHIPEAKEALLRALEFGEKWKSAPHAAHKEEALRSLTLNLVKLGGTFCKLGAQQEAERAYRFAWALCNTELDKIPFRSTPFNPPHYTDAFVSPTSLLVQCAEEYGWFLEKAGRFEEAREVFRHAFVKRERQTVSLPANAITDEMAGDYYLIGSALAELKAPDEAERALNASLRSYEQLLRRQPQNYLFYSHLAACHLRLGHLLRDDRYKNAEYVSAARFLMESVALDTEWYLNKQGEQQRHWVACAAVQAGCGQGPHAEGFDANERARLRQKALKWLRDALREHQQTMEKEPRLLGPGVALRMEHWLQNGNLADVRSSESLGRLPEAEREEWQKLWQEVEELRQRAAQPPKTASSD